MRDRASSAIDISDGLSRDAGHIATASGVLVVIEEALLLAHGGERLDLVLHGGEDYALLVTSPTPIEGFTRIGSIEAGAGVVLANANGRTPVVSRAFDHFV